MNPKTSSKAALITGGVGDIGLAVAKQLAAREFDLVVLDVVSTQRADERLGPLRDQGVKCCIWKRTSGTGKWSRPP